MVFLLLLLISIFSFSQDPLNYLKEYIKIDTKESTKEGVLFFKNIFEENKIEYKIIENGKNSSIIAKIGGTDKSLKPILLTHHIDCVNRGSNLKIHNKLMSGPCLIDDKSLGIAHLFAFLEANKKKPKRGVWFLAVADEEKGGRDGMGHLVENNLLSEIGFAIGEGGRSSSATDKKLFSMISTSEKGAIWLKIKIALEGGHSGSGGDDELREILKKIYSIPKRLPFLGKFEEFKNFFLWYKEAFPSQRIIPSKIEEVEEPFKQYVYTTCSITSIETDGGLNNLPNFISFGVDIRTAEKINHKEVFKFFKNEFPKAEIENILEIYSSPSTSQNDIYFKNFLKKLEKILPNLPIGPGICAGFSDLHYLREKGIPAFGFSPFFLNFYHENTIHKKNERMPEERFLEGVEIMKKLLLKLCEE